MAGAFVVRKDASGGCRFTLPAGNGAVIATSESYPTRASALKGIASVDSNAPGAEVVEVA